MAANKQWRVQIKGERELRRRLRQLGGPELEKSIKSSHEDISRFMAEETAGEAPRLSGRLASRMKAAATKTAARIKNTLIYAGVIHYGWPARNIRSNRYYWRAFKHNRKRIVKTYEDSIKKLARHVVGRYGKVR